TIPPFRGHTMPQLVNANAEADADYDDAHRADRPALVRGKAQDRGQHDQNRAVAAEPRAGGFFGRDYRLTVVVIRALVHFATSCRAARSADHNSSSDGFARKW